MSKREFLAAWTAPPPGEMPAYVNATLVDFDEEDGGVEFTVRSPKDLGSPTSVCRIPTADFLKFIEEFAANMRRVL